MWKFLSALNLVCIMFISGCSKNSNDLKKYDLEFASIKQSAFIYNPYFQNNFNSNLLQVKNQGLNIPYDISRNVGGGYFPNPSLILLVKEKSNVYDEVNNFYRNNGTYSSNAYVVDSLVKFKISIYESEGIFYLNSFSAEMPY
ncbi:MULTISPECIES: hypothetical protein [unclassified Spiroplasma]|uniref:hypothetical protein n=1 Tax=unclassified Spiroplasma TaxID=2637901 RepID=UPI00313B35D0